MNEQEEAALALIARWRGVGRTYQIATHLNMATPRARRLMLRLERQGRVRRHPRYSAVNDISWTTEAPNE
jgi:DNA-binding IclR family transcriptional regulator